MSQTKYDYEVIRNEFVQGPEISIRALAERHGIKSWSTLNAQAIKGKESGLDWYSERGRFQRSLTEKTLTTMASTIATKKATITIDALDVIHAAIFKMAADMQDRWATDPKNASNRIFLPGIIVTPDSLAKLLDRLLTLTGNPSQISENRNIGIDLTEQLPPDVARVIADIAATRGTASRSMGRAALPGPEKSHTN